MIFIMIWEILLATSLLESWKLLGAPNAIKELETPCHVKTITGRMRKKETINGNLAQSEW